LHEAPHDSDAVFAVVAGQPGHGLE
jgi:hypothetical protein